MPEFKLSSWGINYSAALYHAGDLRCTCGFWLEENWLDYVVGFSTQVPLPASIGTHPLDKVGGVIVECPKCHEHSWWHLSRAGVNMICHLCPRWPK